MANAAAKKAAIARKEASGTYFPIVIGINVVYILLCLGTGIDLSFWNIASMLATWGLQYFAYSGILDNAANRNPNDKSLVGGSSLDLLGLTVVIQFGSVLWSRRFYWLLMVAPIWGAYTLYSTVRGATGGGGAAAAGGTAAAEPTEEDEALAEKRQKRSERRRQKRA